MDEAKKEYIYKKKNKLLHLHDRKDGELSATKTC